MAPFAPPDLPLRRLKQVMYAHRQSCTLASKADATPFLSFIRHLDARFTIYTDCSATRGHVTWWREKKQMLPTQSSFYLVIRRRESHNAHGTRVALTTARKCNYKLRKPKVAPLAPLA